jgi:Gram-negative bacterial TonB protein C-terminal
VRMDGAPDSVDVTVPINSTVVLGSDKGDDRHAFAAISVFDRAHADEVPVVYSPSDRSVTPPRVVTSRLLPLSAAAREHHLKGAIVNAEIDEQGHVVVLRVLGARLLSADDQKAIEDVVRTWKFSPATRDGRPVRAFMMIRADYDQSQTTSR